MLMAPGAKIPMLSKKVHGCQKSKVYAPVSLPCHLQDLLPAGQVTLVQVVTEFDSGCWLLFGGALIAMVLGQLKLWPAV